MVKKEHARKALEVVKFKLFNEASIGIKTLDPDDYNYRGYYDNSNNSNDPKVAHGFNYHQGPEWLWPMGYYFRSLMIYANEDEKEDVVKYIQSFLAKHYEYIKGSDWKSLPELTNENGAECIFSCPSQAWTIACLLEACFDMAAF
jgi:glycogen debranching enzyme